MNTLLMMGGLILAIFIGYTVLAPMMLNLPRFLGTYRLICPHSRAPAEVRIHPLQAALTAGYGMPQMRVSRCNQLSPNETCDQNCLMDIKS